VLGLEHDAHPLRLQPLLEPVGDVGRQPLLQLQAPREVLHHTHQLGEADEAPTRQVGDAGVALERKHVMGA
jgi:hypothetical protein